MLLFISKHLKEGSSVSGKYDVIYMFNYILCEKTFFDKILTISILYLLYIVDLSLTFFNLKGLKKLYPRSYMTYERNLIIKWLVKSFGLEKSMYIYFVVGLILFSYMLFYLLQPSLILGLLVGIVFLVHCPNFFEIRKRLKKRGLL